MPTAFIAALVLAASVTTLITHQLSTRHSAVTIARLEGELTLARNAILDERRRCQEAATQRRYRDAQAALEAAQRISDAARAEIALAQAAETKARDAATRLQQTNAILRRASTLPLTCRAAPDGTPMLDAHYRSLHDDAADAANRAILAADPGPAPQPAGHSGTQDPPAAATAAPVPILDAIQTVIDNYGRAGQNGIDLNRCRAGLATARRQYDALAATINRRPPPDAD